MRVLAVAALLAATQLGGCLDWLAADHVGPRDFLSDKYAKWVVEVDYQSGQLDEGVLGWLDGKLSPLVRKSGGVEFLRSDKLASESRSWSHDALRAYAAEHRNHRTEGDTVASQLLFVAGHSASDTDQGRVLGVAFGHELIVLFAQSIRATCDSPLGIGCDTPRVWKAVALHEFGHLLGLVDCGTPMVDPHKDTDPDHGDCHSSNEGSVMYWAVESADVLSLLTGGPPIEFDAMDKADLRANGGA